MAGGEALVGAVDVTLVLVCADGLRNRGEWDGLEMSGSGVLCGGWDVSKSSCCGVACWETPREEAWPGSAYLHHAREAQATTPS